MEDWVRKSTPVSAAMIPNWRELSLPVQALVDFLDANAAEAAPALDHPLLLIIIKPILTRLEAGNDRMPGCSRMLGRMLARRTVAATDVPAFGTSAEMKPPTFR